MALPVDSSWKLTFDEEFNGTSIDKSEWNTNWLGNPGAITKPVNSSELAAYDPAQVSVSGGYLNLSLTKTAVRTETGETYQYSSGLVNTEGNFSQAYGYFEARIHLAGNNGVIDNWPAFWMDGQNWPADGELDVMEGLEGQAAYHFHSPSGGPGKDVPGDYTGWHTFGALWEPGKVSYYYDNKLVGEITSGITSSPQFLILNLGVGTHSVLSAPSNMQVDWVHAYTTDRSGVAVTPETNYTGVGGTGADNLIAGTDSGDVLSGTSDDNTLYGLAGDDVIRALSGADKLFGGQGNDVLVGGAGSDRLVGGTGADTFDIRSLVQSAGQSSDVIADFSHAEGDHISLVGIDANVNVTGNQSFKFSADHAFSGVAGELRTTFSNGEALVKGDIDGDGIADFSIRVITASALVAGDFVL